MKLLLLFCGTAGLLLGSASPLELTSPPFSDAAFLPASAPAAPPKLLYEDVAMIEPSGPQVTFTPAPPPPVEPAEPAMASAAESQPKQAKQAIPAPRAGGDVKIVISLPQQKAYVFQAGELFATSPVSTGKRGYETPVGTFPILQKKVHHRSNKYSNAPMPYMQRLTWSGVAIHAGSLPGYPASHGCIRLPSSFARKLYRITDFDTRVTITRQRPDSPAEALNLA